MAIFACWAIGSLCVSLIRLRSKKEVKLDWKNEIVVITGGESFSHLNFSGSHGLGKDLASQIAAVCKPRKIIVLDVTSSIYESSLIAYYYCDISDRRKIRSVAESIVQDV